MKYIIALAFTLLMPTWANADANIENGKELFENRCHLCHQPPKANALTFKQWKAVLETMQIRMKQSGMDSLTPEETADLHRYLEKQAR